MITVPSLDPCTDIENTDKVMITHANGTTETITGELLNKRNQVIIASTKTLTGTPLKTGNVVRVLFNADQSAADGNTAMVINYNSSNKTVKVCKNGALTNYLPFEVSTGVYKYCQAYTTLEFLYDGTNFIIMGNPVVLSGSDYTIFADGLRRVNNYDVNNKGMITSNAVKEALDKTIPIPTDAVLHYSFDEVLDYPDGTAVYKNIKNFSSVENWISTGSSVVSVENNGLKITNASVNYLQVINTTFNANNLSNKIIKIKYRANTLPSFRLQDYGGNYGTYLFNSESLGNGQYQVLAQTDTYSYNQMFTFTFNSASANNYVVIDEIYIGDGSYTTPIIDNSNGKNNSTNNGGISVQGVSGKGVLLLEGKYLNCGNYHLSNDFSMSIWINPKDVTTAKIRFIVLKQSVFVLRNGSQDADVLQIYGYFKNGGTFNTGSAYGNILPIGWSHLVVVKQGTNLKFYKNGVLVDSRTLASEELADNNNPLLIARDSNTSPQSYDDFLIFDRALTEQEVKALYLNKANTPKYYTLNDYKLAKKLPPPPAADGNYTLKVNVASGVETYSWV